MLKSPKTVEVATEPSVLFAISGTLAKRASQDNFAAIMTYMKRPSLEFQTIFMHDTLNHDKTLAETAAFIRWASKNDGVLFLV